MNIRPRINRWTAARRQLLFSDGMLDSLVQPHFVVDGEGVDDPIPGMPGIHQQSVDVLLKTVEEDAAHGLRAVMLFGVVSSQCKDAEASEAHNAGSHLHRAITEIKAAHGDGITGPSCCWSGEVPMEAAVAPTTVKMLHGHRVAAPSVRRMVRQ